MWTDKIIKAFEQRTDKNQLWEQCDVWQRDLKEQERVSEIQERYDEELNKQEQQEWRVRDGQENCGWYCLYLVTEGTQRMGGNDSLKWDSNFWPGQSSDATIHQDKLHIKSKPIHQNILPWRGLLF